MTLAAITGASRGIGRAVAFALGARGARLALIGRASSALDRTVHELREREVSVSVVQADLAQADATLCAAERLLAEHGVPDVLVNNAGLVLRRSIVDTTPAEFDEQLAVNLRAPFLLTRAVLPGMLARGSGRIVSLGSVSGTVGSRHAAVYAASKWALTGFTKSLAEEVTDTGLSAVVLLPGSVSTDMLVGSPYPARMTPDDVARTVVFHALDAPLAHNGAAIEMFGT